MTTDISFLFGKSVILCYPLKMLESRVVIYMHRIGICPCRVKNVIHTNITKSFTVIISGQIAVYISTQPDFSL